MVRAVQPRRDGETSDRDEAGKARSPNAKADKVTPGKSQIDKFKEAARDLETDDSEEAFDAKLKKVAKPTAQRPKKGD